MATYTSTIFANMQPKQGHIGNQSVGGFFSMGATASSAGDVIFLAKVPNGAVVYDLIEEHTSGSTALGISFGLASGGPAGSATLSCFIAAGAQATFNRRTVLGIADGWTVSVSDNDPNRYGIICASPTSGTQTTSLKINFVCMYRADRNSG